MILVIVPYGYSKHVIKSANLSGASGATVIRARGPDKLSSHSFLGFKIEPEQELVMIMATKEETDNICKGIKCCLADFSECIKSFYILPVFGIDN